MEHNKSEHVSADKHGGDLSTVLSKEERIEVALLIANIEELMRKRVKDNFDASIVTKKQAQQVLKVTNRHEGLKEKKPEGETEEEEKARKFMAAREKELSAPKMVDLKEECLGFLDLWRESVDSRVGALINSPEYAIQEQKEKASAQATPDSTLPAESKIIRKGPLYSDYSPCGLSVQYVFFCS